MNNCNDPIRLTGSWCLIVKACEDGWGRSARISRDEEVPVWQYVLAVLAQFDEGISGSPETAMTVETVDRRAGGFIKVSIDSRRVIPKQVP